MEKTSYKKYKKLLGLEKISDSFNFLSISNPEKAIKVLRRHLTTIEMLKDSISASAERIITQIQRFLALKIKNLSIEQLNIESLIKTIISKNSRVLPLDNLSTSLPNNTAIDLPDFSSLIPLIKASLKPKILFKLPPPVSSPSTSTKISADELLKLYNLNLYSSKGQVSSICVTNSTQHVLYSLNTKNFLIWDLQQKCLVFESKAHKDKINSIKVNTEDTLAATSSWDCSIIIWDLKNYRSTSLLTYCTPIFSLEFTKDSRNLLSTSLDKFIIIWSLKESKIERKLSYSMDRVICINISQDGRFLAFGSNRLSVVCFEKDSVVRTFHGFNKAVNCCAFGTSNEFVVCCDERKVYIAYLDTTEKEIVYYCQNEINDLMMIAYNSSNKAVFRDKYTIYVLDVKEKHTKVLGGNYVNGVCSVVPCNPELIVVFSSNCGMGLLSLQSEEIMPFAGHSTLIKFAIISGNRKYVCTLAGNSMVRLWATKRKSEHILLGHSDEVICAAFTNSSKILATAALDHTIRLWSVSICQQVYCYKCIKPAKSLTFMYDKYLVYENEGILGLVLKLPRLPSLI